MMVYTKESLIERLIEINAKGWVKNVRPGNHGGVGNTLEDLLGIEENNLPIPNAAEWELKAQRRSTSSLITLAHMEPSPRALRAVPRILLPDYGWLHREAGKKYSANEKSFRQTIHAASHSDRGFTVVVDRIDRKIFIEFNHEKVSELHGEWISSIRFNNLQKFSDQNIPYWGFDDLNAKIRTKLTNCFFLEAEVKKQNNEEYYHYVKCWMLKDFVFENFLQLLEQGKAFVDFDARTGHNHGTKFRVHKKYLPDLYSDHRLIFDHT